jgi:hypothetical protein
MVNHHYTLLQARRPTECAAKITEWLGHPAAGWQFLESVTLDPTEPDVAVVALSIVPYDGTQEW